MTELMVSILTLIFLTGITGISWTQDLSWICCNVFIEFLGILFKEVDETFKDATFTMLGWTAIVGWTGIMGWTEIVDCIGIVGWTEVVGMTGITRLFGRSRTGGWTAVSSYVEENVCDVCDNKLVVDCEDTEPRGR